MTTGATAPIGAMNRWLMGQVALTVEERNEDIALIGEAIVSEAQIDAPVATGVLKGSHEAKDAEDGVVEIGAYAEYAAAVHVRHPDKAGWFERAIRMNYKRMVRKQLIWRLRQKGAR